MFFLQCLAVASALLQMPDTLDAVSVTAGRGVMSSGSVPVQSASAGQMRGRGLRSLEEVLRIFAGVSVKDYGGAGGLKTVSFRGLGSQHSSILLDGVAVSDAQNGQVDIGRFDLENVDEVSVSISGQNDIFQSARTLTSSGVLSIRTARPDFAASPFTVSAGMKYASFGTCSPEVMYQQRLGNCLGAKVSAGWLVSQGGYPFTLKNGNTVTLEERLGSDVNALRFNTALYGSLGGGGTVDFKLDWHGSERGLPGSVVLYTQNPTERLWDRNLMASLVYRDTREGGWKIQSILSYSDAWTRYLDTSALYQVPEDDRYRQRSVSAGGVLQKTLGGGWRIAAAADFILDDLWSDIPECPFPVRFTMVPALSAQYDSQKLTFTASLGGTIMKEHVELGDPAPSRSRLSPSAGIVLRLTDGVKLRASLRDGFRLPTFNDLYYARVGNRFLEPEKALQMNIGSTVTGSTPVLDWGFSADLYHNVVRDKILATPTMFIWKMRNAGRVDMTGADVTMALKACTGGKFSFDVRGAYSFQHAVDVTDAGAKNYRHQIPYTPVHSGSLSSAILMPWFNFSYTLVAVGERYSMAQNIDANRIPAYADHGISVNRRFLAGRMHRLAIDAGLEALNLADVNYEVIRYYPMPGRNYRLTVKITY